MPDFKRFLTQTIRLLLLVVLACSVLYFALPADKDNFFAAALDKHRLLKSTPSPRLVFVGGSSLIFGLDSDALSKELGLPVVNDGLYAGFGLRFILNDLKPYIRPGDMVILVPEYEHFYNDLLDGQPESLAGVFEVYPPAVRSLDPSQYLDLPVIYTQVLRIKVNRAMAELFDDPPEETYRRAGFNAYGDLVSHLGLASLRINSDAYILPGDRFNPEAVQVLNDFGDFASARGARVLLVFPPARRSNCRSTVAQFNLLLQYIKEGLAFPMVGSPGEFCFPDGFFFDSPYHMNAEGRQALSAQLVVLLSPLIP